MTSSTADHDHSEHVREQETTIHHENGIWGAYRHCFAVFSFSGPILSSSPLKWLRNRSSSAQQRRYNDLKVICCHTAYFPSVKACFRGAVMLSRSLHARGRIGGWTGRDTCTAELCVGKDIKLSLWPSLIFYIAYCRYYSLLTGYWISSSGI
ncbi:hypothetical protein BDZ97DRAFT_1892896 [Flammula alnicola]|nr:hypothetical protein BDZ97DRAFT_1892896 [Flammula alnicola]